MLKRKRRAAAGTEGEKQFGAKHIGNWCLCPKLLLHMGVSAPPHGGMEDSVSLSWPLQPVQCETLVGGREEVGGGGQGGSEAEVSVSSY